MRVFNVPVTATPTRLDTLIGAENPRCTSILMQAPAANANIVYFGSYDTQLFELRIEANATIPHQNARDIYIVGTAPDRITVMLA